MDIARKIWSPPQEIKTDYPEYDNLPKEGTACRFAYGNKTHEGLVKNRKLEVEEIEGACGSFSGASFAATGTNRNGWNDWELNGRDGWVLAAVWRSQIEAA